MSSPRPSRPTKDRRPQASPEQPKEHAHAAEHETARASGKKPKAAVATAATAPNRALARAAATMLASPAMLPASAVTSMLPEERRFIGLDEGADFGPDVARNLKMLRLERGLSFADLSERTGVSKAMLNQIETGKSSPTIALGWKIANGLGVSFGALLGEAEASDFVVHRHNQVTTLYSESRALRTSALFPPGDTRAAELYELFLEPGSDEHADAHILDTYEQLYVVDGALIIETRNRSVTLGRGDLIMFRADRPHRYINPGTTAAHFYLVMRYPSGTGALETQTRVRSRP